MKSSPIRFLVQVGVMGIGLISQRCADSRMDLTYPTIGSLLDFCPHDLLVLIDTLKSPTTIKFCNYRIPDVCNLSQNGPRLWHGTYKLIIWILPWTPLMLPDSTIPPIKRKARSFVHVGSQQAISPPARSAALTLVAVHPLHIFKIVLMAFSLSHKVSCRKKISGLFILISSLRRNIFEGSHIPLILRDMM